jgi:hypothetical protein
MTDISREPGRIDLRAIDEPGDQARAERVIAAAMSRVAADRNSGGDVLSTIVIYSRPLLAAAAALVVIATGTLITTPRRTQQDPPASVLASWAESNHVPTNGELLAVFQGYDR